MGVNLSKGGKLIRKKLLIGSLAISALVITPVVLAAQSGDDSHNTQNTKSSTVSPPVINLSEAASSSSSSIKLNVNGEDIDVPDNSQLRKTITSDGQTTDVSVDSNHTSSSSGGHNSSHSNVNISVDSD